MSSTRFVIISLLSFCLLSPVFIFVLFLSLQNTTIQLLSDHYVNVSLCASEEYVPQIPQWEVPVEEFESMRKVDCTPNVSHSHSQNKYLYLHLFFKVYLKQNIFNENSNLLIQNFLTLTWSRAWTSYTVCKGYYVQILCLSFPICICDKIKVALNIFFFCFMHRCMKFFYLFLVLRIIYQAV